MELKLGTDVLSLETPLIMGVLNVTPDSFSDGGNFFTVEDAVLHAEQLVREGAHIIDVGGESSRPGSEQVSEEEELRRIIPVIKKLSNQKILVSVDTCKPNVARTAIEAGAVMVNDISGLRDPNMIQVVADYDVPVCIMHMQGDPKTMQNQPQYEDVIEDIFSFFQERIAQANDAGIAQIILDPGIGFGKTLEHNLTILRNMKRFSELKCPLLIGTSRKSFIGTITGADVNNRLPGTLASTILAVQNGANVVRVHDVAAWKQASQVMEAIHGRTH